MTARVLMFQGTGSDVGKSLIVAGLCRLLTNRGMAVRPFKPQNMSNNAAVTADGGEIGRAQALQARAARVAASADMNPVLLKPQSEIGSQIVVQGRVFGTARAREYQARKPELMPYALDSFARLRASCDIVLIEGAGSASEINLRANDIANMGFARAAEAPVILIGDIDRGGVIASLCGTAAVVDPDDARLIAGFIVNKMRGDPTLFADGMAFVADRTGWAPIGLLPYFPDAHRLPAEDILGLEVLPARDADSDERCIRIVVPVLPHIANFDDLDPLRAESGVAIELVTPGRPLPLCDLILLPGSKATLVDLAALKREGWDIDIKAHARRGRHVLGICAGYQMLGRQVRDPAGIEGAAGEAEGLALLDIETVITREKLLTETHGNEIASGTPVAGYEMHMGRSHGPDSERPMLELDGRKDGAVSRDGRIMGCHLHGLFASDAFRRAFLTRFGAAADPTLIDEQRVENALDALARHLELHVDLDALLKVAHAR